MTSDTPRTVRIQDVTPEKKVGDRTFEVTLDEKTLDEIRNILGWVVGPADLREGLNTFYFEAREALGYIDDPKMFRGLDERAAPGIRMTPGRVDVPLMDRR